MSKTILLTGATGFIGSALRSKIKENYNLVGVTRTVLSQEDQTSDLLYVDLSDDRFVKKLPNHVDCVIHLAQSKGYREFPESAHDIRIINVDATCKLLEWARKSGVKQFIYASTANVYGQSDDLLTEDHPTMPNSFYGASKLSAELFLQQYQQFFQIDILRLFTVYGPGQNGMLIPNIIERISTGKSILLAEKVGIYLTPIFVGDVVVVIDKLISAPVTQQIRLINVCGDQVVTLREIVSISEEIIGKPANVQVTGGKAARFTGSNEQLRKVIEPYEFVNIRIGLECIIRSSNRRY